MGKERYITLDVARGIAILLVILGHCCSPSKIFLNEVLLSFHMPLFLFLSGMLAKSTAKDKLLEVIIVKSKRLLIPQITMATVTSCFAICRSGMGGGKSLVVSDILSNYLFWFLPVLLLCYIVQLLISSLVDNFRKANIICLIIAILLIWPSIYIVDFSEGQNINILLKFTVRIFGIIPTALLFYSLGSLLKDAVLKNLCNHRHTNITGLANILLMSILVVLSSLNGFVFMYINDYGCNYFIFIVCALIGIVWTLKFSTLLEDSALLQTAGKYSICLYVWNFAACSFAKMIGNAVSHFVELQPTVVSLLNFTLALIIVLFMTKITINKYSYLYGLR